MAQRWVMSPIARWWGRLFVSVALVAAVTGVISLLDEHIQPLYFLVLYLLVVLPVAIRWGTGLAVTASVLSVLVFAYVFVPPVNTFAVDDWGTGVALGVFLVTAVVVGRLAAGLRRAALAAARLSDEQSALRRVATLVARSAASAAVFEAVTREVGMLCDADLARMERFEADETVTGIAAWSRVPVHLAIGGRFTLDGPSIARDVLRSGGPVRVASFAGATGPIADEARNLGIRSSVGCPIVVAGRVWGVIAASRKSDEPFPVNTESQIASFTELVATAVENAEARAELTASRTRIVATADETRRRIERDLHDGAQQRLVSLALQLRTAQAAVPPQMDALAAELDRVVTGLTDALEELREMARGIHPAILTEGGLAPALKALARRSPLPVELTVNVERTLPGRIEVSAYYVVSEALTNAAKHAHASVVIVTVVPDGEILQITINDDGIGGADPAGGTGLVGLRDRVEALGGQIFVDSPPTVGTTLRAHLPIADGRPAI